MNVGMCASGLVVIIMVLLMVLTAHIANHSSADNAMGYGIFFAAEFFIAIIAGSVFLIILFMKLFNR